MRRLLPLLVLTSCYTMPEGPYSACDPLQPGVCAMPFPSSFYLKEASTETGFQVDFREGSLPINRDDVPFDATSWNRKDGFSISGPILVFFDGVSLDGVIGHDDIGAYAASDAKTVLLNAETGERVPHFVELDMTALNPHERLLMIRPAQPMEFGTRYVVGIRGLVREDGSPVPVSPAMAALRDDDRTDDYDVEARRAHYDDVIFPLLEADGFARDELQLAWDFVTTSRSNTVGSLEAMRDDMLERVGASGPAYTLEVQDHDCSTEVIARTLSGRMTVPLYTEDDGPGTLLSRGADGLPEYNGDTSVEFVVRIPCSVANSPAPTPVLQYGHGLLGDHGEAKTGWLSHFANDNGFVVVATDWTGMSEADVQEITLMLAIDVSDFAMLPERSLQGYVQQMALTRLLNGLATDPAVKFGDVSVIDPDEVVYYGNSQGGIMGGALLAMSPDIERGILGVSGGPYNLLLSRSADFDPFFLIFQNKYTDHRDITLILGLLQMLWDSSESAGWLHDLTDPPEGIPGKTVLIQNGLYDAQVTTLGGHYQARAIGAVTLNPPVRDIFGVEAVDGPVTGNVIVEWDYSDVPDEPFTNTPPDEDHDTHECPRRNPDGQAQATEFLKTGTVSQHCTGVCTDVQATCR